eukprot:4142026-Pleurochrysis_carterae.AAC.1
MECPLDVTFPATARGLERSYFTETAMPPQLGCLGGGYLCNSLSTASRAGHLHPARNACADPGDGGWGLKHPRGQLLPSPLCVASEWRVPPLGEQNILVRTWLNAIGADSG